MRLPWGIGWATTIINAKHKDTELKIKINKEEKDYLTSFLERALDDNLEKRYRFAQYFAHVTASDEYKEGWTKYLEAIKEEVEKLKKEKRELEETIGRSDTDEAESAKARKRLAELENELRTMRRDRTSKITYHALNSFQAMLDQDITCPDHFFPSLWHETVSYSSLPEFPEEAAYITLGCMDKDGNETGRFIAFYPDGTIIEDSIVDDTARLYYPNGQLAVEGKLSGHFIHSELTWTPSGEPIDVE